MVKILVLEESTASFANLNNNREQNKLSRNKSGAVQIQAFADVKSVSEWRTGSRAMLLGRLPVPFLRDFYFFSYLFILYFSPFVRSFSSFHVLFVFADALHDSTPTSPPYFSSQNSIPPPPPSVSTFPLCPLFAPGSSTMSEKSAASLQLFQLKITDKLWQGNYF